MLGNVDAFVIHDNFGTAVNKGERVTDILAEYFHRPEDSCPYRRKRIATFSRMVGLGAWDGKTFAHEQRWLRYYRHHLKNNVAFQVFSLTDQKLHSLLLPMRVYLGHYNRELEMTTLLTIWLEVLKKEMAKEAELCK